MEEEEKEEETEGRIRKRGEEGGVMRGNETRDVSLLNDEAI